MAKSEHGAPGAEWYNRKATKINKLTREEIPEEACARLWALTDSMRCDGGTVEDRRNRTNDALTLYFGSDSHGTFAGGSLLAAVSPMSAAEPVAANVIQYCADTMASHLCRQKVRPLWVTEKGSPKLQRKAKRFQRCVEGQADAIGLYGMLGIEICYHGLLFDGVGLQSIPDYANSRVDHQIVWAHEMSVPIREARANNVRTFIRTYDVDRQVLLHRFRDKGEKVLRAIREAQGVSVSETAVDGHETEDRILVREAWHLPSSKVDLEDPKSWTDECDHDGRHVLCLEKADLINEAWPLDHTLIAWFRPLKRPGSFWSRGIPATLANVQLKINEWNRRIDGLLKLHAVPRLIVWAKAKMSKSKWTNDYASMITSSMPPSQSVMRLDANSVPAELVNRVDNLIAWAEKQVGLSELSISAARPPGIDHAPGLQQLQDQESIRHTVAYRSWEQFHLDWARNEVEAFRFLTRVNKNFKLIFGDSEELISETWADVDFGRDRAHLRAWPTALLPLTPGARLSRVIDMLGQGLITPEQALQMLDFPDIDAVMGDKIAERENIEKYLERAQEAGAVTDECAPHAWLNLGTALEMTKQRINRLEADGVEQDEIEGLRAFYQAVSEKMAEGQPPTAPPMAQGVPPADPMAQGAPPMVPPGGAPPMAPPPMDPMAQAQGALPPM